MFPLCLPFFSVRLHTSTEMLGAGEKEKRTGNLRFPETLPLR
jgi:hypothetical protein